MTEFGEAEKWDNGEAWYEFFGYESEEGIERVEEVADLLSDYEDLQVRGIMVTQVPTPEWANLGYPESFLEQHSSEPLPSIEVVPVPGGHSERITVEYLEAEESFCVRAPLHENAEEVEKVAELLLEEGVDLYQSEEFSVDY